MKTAFYRQCHPDWLFRQEGSRRLLAVSYINNNPAVLLDHESSG